MFDEPLEVGHDETGFLGGDTNDPLMESWICQMDQIQQKVPTTSNMSNESLTSFSLTSGTYQLLGLGHGETGFLGRDTNDPLMESWILQIGQLQKKINITPNMSIESLTSFSLTSGEYITIYLKPWIISTTKEKEVPTLQYVFLIHYAVNYVI